MNIFKCTVIAWSFILFTNALNAQFSEQELRQKADSAQRLLMKDSLQISDGTVDQIFSVRDEMYQKINAIRSNTALTAAQQDQQVSVVREQVNEGIRAILGEQKFRHYLEIIRNKLRQQNMQSEVPLAGATEN